jgi:hypothetical protein
MRVEANGRMNVEPAYLILMEGVATSLVSHLRRVV